MPQFTISKVEQVLSYIIRVTFTDIPYVYSTDSTVDAANIQNYTLIGPNSLQIDSTMPTEGDPYSVDLFLSDNIRTSENWELTVSAGLKSVNQLAISNDLVWTFVGIDFPSSAILGGAKNEKSYHLLRRNINPILSGKTWNALISAIATGEQANWDNAEKAFNQLFVSSAESNYLKQRGSDYGVQPPKNVGLSDTLYRKYILQLKNRQLTLDALNEMVEVFFGADSTRGNAISVISESYALANGYDLFVSVDGSDSYTVFFDENDFANIAQASALEVSVALNKSFEDTQAPVYALPYLDPETNTNKVRLYSQSLGIGSRIQINGGRAQSIFRFETFLDLYNGIDPLPTWDIVLIPSTGRIRFITTTSPTQFDISGLQEGDYVNIFGSEFNGSNQGSFPILNVERALGPLEQYFEIENIDGTAEIGVVQLDSSSLDFFRPILNTINSSPTAAFVTQAGDETIDVVLPATSPAVTREEFTGAYLQENTALEISSIVQTGRFDAKSIDISLSSNISAGLKQVLVSDVYPDLDPPATTAGNLGLGQTASSPITITDVLSNLTGAAIDPQVVRTPDGGVFYIGGGAELYGDLPTNVVDWRFAYTESFQPSGGIRYTTGGFSWTMNVSRKNCAASPVFAGNKILVTGGASAAGETAISSCELVSLGSSAFCASMTARMYHSQITLTDGRVLVVGGSDSVGTVLSSCEVYDPITNTWAPTGSMAVTRRKTIGLVQLANGNVLVVGGRDDTPSDNLICEEWNGATWSIVGNRGDSYSLLNSTVKVPMILARSGEVWALNGPYSVEIYNSDLKYWRPGPKMLNLGTLAGLSFNDATYKWAYINGSDASPSNTTITDFNYERLVVFYQIETGTTDPLIKTQYLDLTPCALEDSGNDLCWKPGPSIELGSYSNGRSFETSWASGNLVFLGRTPDSVGSANKLAAYIINCDGWGVSKLNAGPAVGLSDSTSISLFEKQTPQYYANLLVPTTSAELVTAEDGDSIAGPYLWDASPNLSTIGGAETQTTQQYLAGNAYTQIKVVSTANLPATGWIGFNFGYADSVMNVAYSIVIDSTTLKLSKPFTFPITIASGSLVTEITSPASPDPENANVLGSCYLTDSPSGRVAAEAALDRIVAGGMEVTTTIKYPDDTGLGAAGFAESGSGKLSEIVEIYSGSGDEVDDF